MHHFPQVDNCKPSACSAVIYKHLSFGDRNQLTILPDNEVHPVLAS